MCPLVQNLRKCGILLIPNQVLMLKQLLFSSMANQSKDIESGSTTAYQFATRSPAIVSEESREKRYRRSRSISPMLAALPVESTINAVQTLLNKRQLQVQINFVLKSKDYGLLSETTVRKEYPTISFYNSIIIFRCMA